MFWLRQRPQDLTEEASKPKLQLKTATVDSTFCSATSLRLTLQLTFETSGSVPILIRKEGFHIGRYLINRHLGGLRKGKREADVRQEFNTLWVLRNRLEGRTVDTSTFVRLTPGTTHIVPMEFYLSDINDVDDPQSLRPGNYLLEIQVSTWLDTNSIAARLQNEYKAEGYLWTNSVISDPLPFTISDKKMIGGCN